ncbi:GyrI-like domain-containing protein [Clostridium punense]|uniref:GyrI-like domain-containing protein n=1 Tax=Clostridium punense TaxID=1054297 RepID=UPI00362306FD
MQEQKPAVWTRITTEWITSSGYERSTKYEIEVYPPGNTDSDDYICEIWVPVNRKK